MYKKLSILLIFLIALLFAGTAAAVPQEDYVPGQILVLYDAAAATPLPAVETLHDFSSLVPGLQVIRIPDGMSVEDAVAYYERIPGVVFAEPDYLRVSTDIEEPDDEYFKYQWHLQNLGALIQKIVPDYSGPEDAEISTTAVAYADVQALDAWNITNGSADILVAVIDTGIMYTHEDLGANIWTNSKEIPDNLIDDDNNGYIDDVYGWNFGENNNNPMDYGGHGTHCAGIIGAVGNNGIGVIGVSPNVTIMPLKVADNRGGLSSSGIVEAIQYGSYMGVRIFSCSYGSFGSGGYSKSEYAVMAAAENCLFICAAGNEKQNVDYAKTAAYPAGYNLPNILSVAATTHDDKLDTTYSNYGVRTVHVAAPGTAILSTVPDATTATYNTTTDMEWYEYRNDTEKIEKIFATITPIVLDKNNATIISLPVEYNLEENAEAGCYFSGIPFDSFSSLNEMKKYSAPADSYAGKGQKETVIYLSKDWIASVNAPVYVGFALSTEDTESSLQVDEMMKVLGRIDDPVSVYKSYRGTSMATPVVSGIAALVLSRNPDLTPVQLKEVLMTSVDPSENLRTKVISGGRVNAYMSVNNSISRLSAMEIVPKKITLSTGSTYQFAEPTGYDQFNREFTLSGAEWTSDRPNIAAINATTGVLYAKSPGTVKIHASWNDLDADAVVTVMNAKADSLTVRSATTYTAGSAGTFTAYVYDAKKNRIPNYPVIWSSSNPDILSVDELTGNYLAYAEGDVEITAASADGLSDTVQVTVSPAPEPLTIDDIRLAPASVSLMEGRPLKVIATAVNTSTNTTFPDAVYHWETDKEDVVDIETPEYRMATLTLNKSGEEPFNVSVTADSLTAGSWTKSLLFGGDES